MANEKRLIYLEDAIEKIVNFPSKVAIDAFYSKKKFTPMQMLTVVTDRQHEIIDLLKKVKEVDAVEVKHGRWLFDSHTERCFCSACNEEALYTSKDDPIFDYDWEENLRYSHTETILEEHLTNYCPNCGAKMDGDGNG